MQKHKVKNGALIHADCREAMPTLPEASMHSIVTDPPYGLSFMGKGWDHGVPGEEFWREALRVLKPGGHLLAFGGTRTFHRLTCAIEDAGFEIRDCLMWVYGSGFPKSLDVSKAIDKAAGAERTKIPVGSPVKRIIPGADQHKTGSWIKDNGRTYQPGVEIPATEAAIQWEGWGTALKPAWEPIILARKPFTGTVAANVLEHGTGALNIDGCRVESDGSHKRTFQPTNNKRVVFGQQQGFQPSNAEGRWPANLIHDGSEEVVDCFPVDTKKASGKVKVSAGGSNRTESNSLRAGSGMNTPGKVNVGVRDHGDAGSAARFFYCAKASKADRGEGNKHPTVKPTDLMRYLCRLITPPGGIVLDPFMGSGSTGVAATDEGFRFIGIESEESYIQIAQGRIGPR